MKKVFILLIVMLNLFQHLNAQQNKIDSLLTLLKTDAADTNKVIHLNKLCWEYQLIGEYDKGITYGKQALALAETLPHVPLREGDKGGGNGWKKGIATSYNNIGGIYYSQGNYPEALKNYFASLKIYEEIKNKKGIANSYNGIGIIYRLQGNYPEALKNHFASLKIREEIKDKKGIATSYHNIGNIYTQQGNYPEALKNYFASLKIREEIKDKRGIAASYGNIGIIYRLQGNYPEALKNYFATLKMFEEIGDKDGIATSYINLGTLYTKLAAYPPLEGAGGGNPPSNSPKGEINKHLAQTYLDSALALSIEIGSKDDLKETYAGLAVLDSVMGNSKQEILNYKLYILYRDSLDNEETQKKTIQSSMTYEFDKKEIATKAAQDKVDAIALEEKQKQRIVLSLVSCLLIFVAIFSVFMYRRFKITERQKVVIEKQKALVDVKNKEIEEHQKEITDSINYAKRIQYSLFASNELLDKHLTASPNPHVESRVMAVSEPPSHQIAGQARNDARDYFVFFKPKDIVSGDFYWATEYNNNFYLAVCDSTGHGVPGAFMSILNMSFLSEAIKEKDISKPNEILNYVRQRLIETISKEGQKDGMDCILIKLEFPSPLERDGRVRCEYAAANNEPILLRDGNIIELAKDRMPVGKGEKTADFTLQTVELQKGDSLILYTDGYADQFGGDKGKKFKYKPLNEMLLANQQKPCNEQKEILNTTLHNWKGSLEQVDDITIIGIRV